MESLLNKFIGRADSHIYLAKEMHKRCSKRKRKSHSYYRVVLSFFVSRSWEMYKSVILLVKAKRVVDAAILVRSLCNMAIDLAYITKDSKKKEVESIKYCIEGDKAQIKIINANLKGFRSIDSNIDLRKNQLEQNVENLIKHFRSTYLNETSWKYPRWISTRAEKAGGLVLDLYNQVYKSFSNIEHHNIFFGQDYVNFEKYEPILSPKKVLKSDLYRPEFLLYLYEWIYLSTLYFFNREYRLGFKDELIKRIRVHKKAFAELKMVRDGVII